MIRIDFVIDGEMEQLIADRVRAGGFASAEEYVESVLTQHFMPPDPPNIKELILDGLASGEGEECTPEYWERQKAEFLARHGVKAP